MTTSTNPMPMRRTWKNATELTRAASAGDEFSPEVAKVLAEVRRDGGVSNVSCTPAGNTPAELDALREQLREAVPGLSRRGFLQITGAAAVFGLAACAEKHPDTLVPYANQPEGTTLGNALHYSSTLRDSGHPVAVVVKTYDGRPIKLDGNPDHPLSRGRADARTQAALLNLYDPDRLQDGPLTKTAGKTGEFQPIGGWSKLDTEVGAALKTGKVLLVTPPLDGPADLALIADLGKAFGARFTHAAYSAFPRTVEAEARSALLGDARLPVYRADRAAVLLAFGDFLGGGHTGLAEQVEFGDLRRAGGQVIAVEPTLSQVGTCADVRVRVAPDRAAWAAWGVAELVGKVLNVALPTAIQNSLDQARGASLGESLGLRAVPTADGAVPALRFIADRLIATKNAGKNSLIYAGGVATSNRAQRHLHLAAVWLNAVLGNEGISVVVHERAPLVDNGAFDQALAAGDVGTVILAGVNPVYSAPALAGALEKAKTIVALSDRLDESAALATLVAPTAHGLESWGDAEARPGIVSLQQPAILPLWDSRPWQESLLAFAVAAGVAPEKFVQDRVKADPKVLSVVGRQQLWQPAVAGVITWQQYVRTTWLAAIKPHTGAIADERTFWLSALSRGVIEIAANVERQALKNAEIPALSPWSTGGMQVVVSASRIMGDGALLNNAWLQEIPDPVSRITWDTYVAVSPVDAKAQGWAQNDVVAIAVGATPAIALPVHVQEGTQPGVIEVFLGWGRTRAGRVASLARDHAPDGSFSVDLFPLVGRLPAVNTVLTATLTKTGAQYKLADMQGHDWQEGREIALDQIAGESGEKAKAELWERGTDGKAGGNISMWSTTHEYPGHRWGMSVDLNTCTGCNACIVACQAENNIPVVGRDEVRKQRQMHWMRIDRYYSANADDHDHLDVEVVHQPLMCQQCENAPCEAVCPANATMHNNEGISIQVYNRCIGTRYCANNCPYKVRRFNWYEYSAYRAGPVGSSDPFLRIAKNLKTDHATSSQAELTHAPLAMLLNPEVTVRSRGVMEKCNFCVQRTREVRGREKLSGKRIADGEITTACAQTCPTKALVFGDLNDEHSEVVQISQTAGAYKLLDAELNTRPTVTYLKRTRQRPATAADSDKGHG